MNRMQEILDDILIAMLSLIVILCLGIAIVWLVGILFHMIA